MQSEENGRAGGQAEPDGTRVRASIGSFGGALIRTRPGRAALALALMLALGLTEGIGLMMLVPLLDLAGIAARQGAVSGIARLLSSVYGAVGMQPTLLSVLGTYVLIVSLHGLLYRWQLTASVALQQEFMATLRQNLYAATIRCRWLFFSQRRASDFVHLLTTEVERAGMAAFMLLQLLAASLVTLAYIALAVHVSPGMSAVALATGGLLALALRGKRRAARSAGEGMTGAMGELHAAVSEHLGGAKAAKSFGVEDRHVRLFAALVDRVRQLAAAAVRTQAGAQQYFEIGTVLALSAVLYVSIEVLALSPAALLLLLFLFARILPRFSTIQESYQRFLHYQPAYHALLRMQSRCEAAAEPTAQLREPIDLREAVCLENVSFAYRTDPVIRDLHLAVRMGEITALVGPSGSGKSTVADLVIGLLEPDRGRVLVDGVPLTAGRMQAWRGRIGYVAQDTFLFHDTVRANLLWASTEATAEDLDQALALADAAEFVSRLPHGLETVGGDRGVQLSGGERQRLALARALLRKPRLLILDEATSHLDLASERRILQAIEALRSSTAVLLISHRLSTIQGADVIHVLEGGRIVESGDWPTLAGRESGRLRTLSETEEASAAAGR
jgi:ATP-binding cassette subfamily C protein